MTKETMQNQTKFKQKFEASFTCVSDLMGKWQQQSNKRAVFWKLQEDISSDRITLPYIAWLKKMRQLTSLISLQRVNAINKTKWMPTLRNCYWYWRKSFNNFSTCIDATLESSKYQIHQRFLKLKRDFFVPFSQCSIHCRFGHINVSWCLNLSGHLQSWFQRPMRAFWQTHFSSFLLRARGLPTMVVEIIEWNACFLSSYFHKNVSSTCRS